jgi:hypothetical protein
MTSIIFRLLSISIVALSILMACATTLTMNTSGPVDVQIGGAVKIAEKSDADKAPATTAHSNRPTISKSNVADYKINGNGNTVITGGGNTISNGIP